MLDQNGDLYGVTASGGTNRGGTVFELIPASHGSWKHKVLHSFCSNGCLDGQAPDAGLIMDVAGNLYGTTSSGGKYDQGAIYQLTPNAAHTRWHLRVLHSFCATGGGNCPDGAFLTAPLTYNGAASGALYDGVSPLYGTTVSGGAFAWGTAFRIMPVSGKKIWSLKTLYSFCARPNCADGAAPTAALRVDASGVLLGTTSEQNSGNPGVVFELTPNAKKTKWTETVLHTFCSVGNCLDGADPSGLVADGAGNLFGVADIGGSGTQMCYNFTLGCGVAYTLAINGGIAQETVLYNFCSFQDCDDGYNPQGNVVVASSGSIFGTTAYGGGNDVQGVGIGGGTLFELDAAHDYVHVVLHSFCAEAGCADGAQPLGNLIVDGSGNIFGVTAAGGTSGLGTTAGTVFELSP